MINRAISAVRVMAAASRHSKLQREVLRVYRQLLRASNGKVGMREYIRSEFQRNAKEIDGKNVLQIEYLLRRAQKQLKGIGSIDRVTDMVKRTR